MTISTASHRGDGVESARGNDLRAGSLRLGVVFVDHVLHPGRFPGQVAAMNAGTRAGGHKLASVQAVRAHRCQYHLFSFNLHASTR